MKFVFKTFTDILPIWHKIGTVTYSYLKNRARGMMTISFIVTLMCVRVERLRECRTRCPVRSLTVASLCTHDRHAWSAFNDLFDDEGFDKL